MNNECIVKETESTPVINTTSIMANTQIHLKLNVLFIERLRSLAYNPSRESIQTLARWKLFHRRKHAHSLCHALYNEIESDNTSPLRKITYLDVVHEMLILDCTSIHNNDTRRWDRWAEIRSILGEEVVRPALDCVRSALFLALTSGSVSVEEVEVVVSKLRAQSLTWIKLDCFDSPTLLDEAESTINSIGIDFERYRGKTPFFNESEKNSYDFLRIRSHKVNEPSENMRELSVQRKDKLIQNNIVEGSKFNFPSRSVSSETSDQDDKKEKTKLEDIVISTPTPSDLEDNEDLFGVDNNDEILKEAIKKDINQKKSLILKDREERKKNRIFKFNLSTNQHSDKKYDVLNKQQREEEISHQEFSSGCIWISQLHDSCKSITSMQINRDLRSDTTLHYSMLLSMVPDCVISACSAAFDTQSKLNTKNGIYINSEIMEALPDDVLDLDISNAITNVKIYGDIISQQRASKQKCIELLFKTNFQFGSEKAAKLFYYLVSREEVLQGRKEKIRDAMELEGLDFEGLEDEDSYRDEDTLSEFTWYSKNQGYSCTKRPRL